MAKQEKCSLIAYLESFDLQPNVENDLLKNALTQLNNKQSEQKVLHDLCSGFRDLAIAQNISKDGLALYTQLQKPNFSSDFARSFNLWI